MTRPDLRVGSLLIPEIDFRGCTLIVRGSQTLLDPVSSDHIDWDYFLENRNNILQFNSLQHILR